MSRKKKQKKYSKVNDVNLEANITYVHYIHINSWPRQKLLVHTAKIKEKKSII